MITRHLAKPHSVVRRAAAVITAGLLLAAQPAAGQESERGHTAENAALKVRLSPRTPEQIAAFYEGRGFPGRMVELLRDMCFITTIVSNKSEQVIWHDLDAWRFSTSEGAVPRVTRPDWKARWADMDAPMPNQSTFRWTLMPDRLDFRPGESEGGNIVLPHTDSAIRIEARFYTNADRSGEPIILHFEDVYCAKQEARTP